jgi:hypothetical protein
LRRVQSSRACDKDHAVSFPLRNKCELGTVVVVMQVWTKMIL